MLLTVGLDQWPERVEEPSMTVQLLLILLFQAENNLDGTSSLGNFSGVCHHYMRGIPTERFEDVEFVVVKGLTRRYVQ